MSMTTAIDQSNEFVDYQEDCDTHQDIKPNSHVMLVSRSVTMSMTLNVLFSVVDENSLSKRSFSSFNNFEPSFLKRSISASNFFAHIFSSIFSPAAFFSRSSNSS
uniref:Uncharacterized protein n=1 Tax=Romanomermis culicivorax TaxID=13658 RepID=A0A915JMD7_ROMCU